MTTLEIILSIVTVLSGATNLGQWANISALRKKGKYEAEEAHIEVLNRTIVMQAKEIERLQARVKELEDKGIEREHAFEERIKQLEEKYANS